MATFNSRAFCRIDDLQSISPKSLLRLLAPHEAVFRRRGCALPDASPDAQIDYDRLAHIFMTPDHAEAALPYCLLDALHILTEMATPEGMNALIGAAQKQGIRLEGDAELTPIDVAVQVWLHNDGIVRRLHAEQRAFKVYSYEHFPVNVGFSARLKPLTQERIRSVERDLNAWFVEHQRGDGARVFEFPSEDGSDAQFLIRHGMPMVRQPSLNSGQPGVELFRPAIYDVVDFNSAINELAIHAGTVGERKLYREVFGKHLFGDKGTFGESDKYTLDPIRTQGEACLACDDIPGMEEVVLTELHLLWGGAQGEIEIRRAHNIFLALAARDQSIPSRPKIVKAKFAVRFTGSLLPRKVTVSVPNRTNCRRHEDREIVEEWLQARGFYADRSSSTPLFDWLRRSA